MQILSPILQIAYSFCWWRRFFCAETFYFDVVPLIFLLMPLLAVSDPKDHCQDQCYGVYGLCFLQEFYDPRYYLQVLNFELILHSWKRIHQPAIFLQFFFVLWFLMGVVSVLLGLNELRYIYIALNLVDILNLFIGVFTALRFNGIILQLGLHFATCFLSLVSSLWSSFAAFFWLDIFNIPLQFFYCFFLLFGYVLSFFVIFISYFGNYNIPF